MRGKSEIDTVNIPESFLGVAKGGNKNSTHPHPPPLSISFTPSPPSPHSKVMKKHQSSHPFTFTEPFSQACQRHLEAQPTLCRFLDNVIGTGQRVSSCFSDTSGSTRVCVHYQAVLNALHCWLLRNHGGSTPIYVWGSKILQLRTLSRSQLEHGYTYKNHLYHDLEGCGGTEPQVIASVLRTNPRLCEGTVVILTDGQIYDHDVQRCRSMLEGVRIERLVFIIDGSSRPNISVYQPFAERAREVHVLTQGQVRFSGRMMQFQEFESAVNAIQTLEDFENDALTGTLYNSISSLRTNNSARILELLRNMRQRVERNIASCQPEAPPLVDTERLRELADAAGCPLQYASYIDQAMQQDSPVLDAVKGLYAGVSKMMALARNHDSYDMQSIEQEANREMASLLDPRTRVGNASQQDVAALLLENACPLEVPGPNDVIESLISYEDDVPCVAIPVHQEEEAAPLFPGLGVRNQDYSRLLNLVTLPDNRNARDLRQWFGSLEGFNALLSWFTSNCHQQEDPENPGRFRYTKFPTDPYTRQEVATLFPLLASSDEQIVRLQNAALRHLFVGREYGSPVMYLLLFLHYVRTLPELRYLVEHDEMVVDRLVRIVRLRLETEPMPLGVLGLEDLPRQSVPARYALLYLCSSMTVLKYFDPWRILPLADTLALVFSESPAHLEFVRYFERLVRSMQYIDVVKTLVSDTSKQRDALGWLARYTNYVDVRTDKLYPLDALASTEQTRQVVFTRMPEQWRRSLSVLPAALQETRVPCIVDVMERLDLLTQSLNDECFRMPQVVFRPAASTLKDVQEHFQLDENTLKPSASASRMLVPDYGTALYKLALRQKGNNMRHWLTHELSDALASYIYEKYGVFPVEWSECVAYIVGVMKRAWHHLVDTQGEEQAAQVLVVKNKNQRQKARKMERRRRYRDITSATCNSRLARKKRRRDMEAQS